MRSKGRRDKCVERTYELIKEYGPCTAQTILPILNNEFSGNIMRNELGKYIAYLHGCGRIVLEDGSGHVGLWRVVDE